MMGYADISTLAHKIEDLFVELRDNHLQLQPIVTDLLLYALDAMTSLLDGLENSTAETIDIEPVVGLFDALLDGKAIEVPHVQTTRTVLPHRDNEPATEEDAEKTEPAVEDAEEQHYVRIQTKDLDHMLNLVGEVLMNQYRYDGQLASFHHVIPELIRHRQHIVELQEYILRNVDLATSSQLFQLSEHLEQESSRLLRTTKMLVKKIRTDRQQMHIAVDNLQEQVVDIRMVPAARIFNMLPRLTRMTARSLGKQVDLQMVGEETRIDTRIIEELRDPLIHLIQNAVRHGIELPQERQRNGKSSQGNITVSASQEGNRIVVCVKDDGYGINLDRIKNVAVQRGVLSQEDVWTISEQDLYDFLFQSGFSTADNVDDIAGRGFGLDIVRDHIDRVQGEIEVRSQPGGGTEFRLTLPLTLTIMNTLMVRVADQIFAVPTSAVERTFDYYADQIEHLGQIPTVAVDGVLLPIIDLQRLLRFSDRHPFHNNGQPSPSTSISEHLQQTVIVLCSEDRRIGFIVDDLVEEREIVIKHLGPCLKRVRHVAGATALREETVIILFVRDLIHSADDILGETHAHSMLLEAHARKEETLHAEASQISKILVIDDSLNTREVERTMLEHAGYLVETAANGNEGLHKLRTSHFDIVITDIEMPHMNGLQVTRYIKQDRVLHHIPVIIVSARHSEEARRESLDAGAVAHIVKGEFNEQSLIQTVTACLEKSPSPTTE
jgi:two-component system chemotaxis sensor kinase CheA